ERCKIHDTNADAVNVSFNLICRNSEIYASTNASEMDPVANSPGYLRFENNYVHDNSGGLAHTIQTYPGPSGQSAASIIRNNYLYNNPKWGVYLQQYITNVVVEDNVLYDCAYAGSLGAIFGTLNNGSARTVNSNIWIRGN